MNKQLTTILALTAMLSASGARADDPFYAGAAVTGSHQLTLHRNGVKEESRSQHALRLSGGYQLNDNFAIEAGYVRFGDFKYASGPAVDMDAIYTAVKGSIPVGEKFSVFGKIGVAYHGQKVTGLGGVDGNYHTTKTLLSAGGAWHVTDKVALSLEVADYGTVKTRAGQVKARQLEAGLNFKF